MAWRQSLDRVRSLNGALTPGRRIVATLLGAVILVGSGLQLLGLSGGLGVVLIVLGLGLLLRAALLVVLVHTGMYDLPRPLDARPLWRQIASIAVASAATGALFGYLYARDHGRHSGEAEGAVDALLYFVIFAVPIAFRTRRSR